MRKILVVLLLAPCLLFAQRKQMGLVPGNPQEFRLEPGKWYPIGPFEWNVMSNARVKLSVQVGEPVTLATVTIEGWNAALQTHVLPQLFCVQSGIMKADYECADAPGFGPFVVVVHDDRDPNAGANQAVLLGLGAYVTHSRKMAEDAVSAAGSGRDPNDATITPWFYGCAQNCDLPVLRWHVITKEKFPVLNVVKSYGPFTAERELRIKVKSPVPLAMAVVPVDVAVKVRQDPSQMVAVFASAKCQQRGSTDLDVSCSLDPDLGQVELLLVPEAVGDLPAGKVATITVSSLHCVENCDQTKYRSHTEWGVPELSPQSHRECFPSWLPNTNNAAAAAPTI